MISTEFFSFFFFVLFFILAFLDILLSLLISLAFQVDEDPPAQTFPEQLSDLII